MSYVDGFLLPVPTKNLAEYRKLARIASKVWIEHGALDYMECVGDHLDIQGVASFPKLTKLKQSETLVFAFIVYKSRRHRDRVNAKVMRDPRMACMPHGKLPFDIKRMNYGGFKAIVEAKSKPPKTTNKKRASA